MVKIQAATAENIAAVAARLRAGGLAAMPTETVYGLAALAGDDRAVAEIYAAKGRPQFNPLIVHVADVAMAARYVIFTPLAEKLAAAFWPGPLTLVLKRRADCALSLLVSAGLDTAAIRAPSHPAAQALIRAAGEGIAAPSANRSGRISPTRAAHVAEEFAGQDLCILDGGECAVGLESSVVDCTGERAVLLRHGGIAREAIEAILGESCAISSGEPDAPRSPGQLLSHYAPSLPVRLNADFVEEGEALLAFGEPLATTGPMLNLSAAGDVIEAASRLFAAMRQLDAPECTAIAVMPIPEEGLGAAINDRLRRAAQ